MPTLPLPLGGAPLSGGDLPIIDATSVAALEPYVVQQSDTAPVRDAVRAALVALFAGYWLPNDPNRSTLGYQSAASTAAAQCDPTRATGIYLDGLGRDRGVFRANGELDIAYRARVLIQGSYVTPNAIIAAANAVLAPFTSVQAAYLESIQDRGFVYNGVGYNTPPLQAPPWSAADVTDSPQPLAYVRTGVAQASGSSDTDPDYADRLYPGNVAYNGAAIARRRPGGFWCFGDDFGRYFVLRVPMLAGLTPTMFAADGVTAPQLEVLASTGVYAFNGSNAPVDFISNGTTFQSLYQTIINTVSRLVAHSVRWQLVVDPALTA